MRQKWRGCWWRWKRTIIRSKKALSEAQVKGLKAPSEPSVSSFDATDRFAELLLMLEDLLEANGKEEEKLTESLSVEKEAVR